MSDVHEALKRKFAQLAVVNTTSQPAAPPRVMPSTKSKSRRERLVVSINGGLISDLRALKLALGVDVSDLVEEMVAKGIAEKVADVKKSKPGEWDVIRRFAHKR